MAWKYTRKSLFFDITSIPTAVCYKDEMAILAE
jgi:hypothetical protein